MTRIVASGAPTATADPAAQRVATPPTGVAFQAVLSAADKADPPWATDASAVRQATAPSAGHAEIQAAADPIAPDGAPRASTTDSDAPGGSPQTGHAGRIVRVRRAGRTAATAAAGAAPSELIVPPHAIAGATPVPASTVPGEDSPVAAWLAAAVGRAIGSLGAAAGPAAAPPAAAAASAATAKAAAAPAFAAGLAPATPVALTPLEQAVHELIDRLADHDPARPRVPRPPPPVPGRPAAAEVAPLDPFASRHASVPADPGREIAASVPAPATAAGPPEPPANPSHVHLVVDDGPERVVVTVAVRGGDVRVVLRAGDDATAAALARNAASLDHAMRARGLALGELIAEHEPREPQPPEELQPRNRQEPDAEPFELED